MFVEISLEALISWFIGGLLWPFIVINYLAPEVDTGVAEKLKKIINPPSEKLLLFISSIGHSALWIILAILVAAIVPMFEQVETYTQVCRHGVVTLDVSGCNKLEIHSLWTNNHVHVAQVLVWLLCIAAIWFWCMKCQTNHGAPHVILSTYYFATIVFIMGGFIQQALTMSLPGPL